MPGWTSPHHVLTPCGVRLALERRPRAACRAFIRSTWVRIALAVSNVSLRPDQRMMGQRQNPIMVLPRNPIGVSAQNDPERVSPLIANTCLAASSEKILTAPDAPLDEPSEPIPVIEGNV